MKTSKSTKVDLFKSGKNTIGNHSLTGVSFLQEEKSAWWYLRGGLSCLILSDLICSFLLSSPLCPLPSPPLPWPGEIKAWKGDLENWKVTNQPTQSSGLGGKCQTLRHPAEEAGAEGGCVGTVDYVWLHLCGSAARHLGVAWGCHWSSEPVVKQISLK